MTDQRRQSMADKRIENAKMKSTIAMLAVAVTLLIHTDPAEAMSLLPSSLGDGTKEAYCGSLANGSSDAGVTVFLMEEAGC